MGCVVSHRKSRLFKPPKQQEGKMQWGEKVERILVMCYYQQQSLCQDFWDLPSQTALRAQKHHLELPRMVWMTDIQSTHFKYCLFALCKQHLETPLKKFIKKTHRFCPQTGPCGCRTGGCVHLQGPPFCVRAIKPGEIAFLAQGFLQLSCQDTHRMCRA